jgi:hypothetical protein
VEVHLPELAQRVGLDEVALIVDVESVIDSVVFQLGYVTWDIDNRHRRWKCMPVGCDFVPGLGPRAVRGCVLVTTGLATPTGTAH